MSIGLTTCTQLRYPQLLPDRPSTTITACLPTQQRKRGHESRRHCLPGMRCRPVDNALSTGGKDTFYQAGSLEWRALSRLRESLWNQKIQKNLCYYGNASTALHDSSSSYCCCVLDFILLLLLLTGAAWFSSSRRVLARFALGSCTHTPLLTYPNS